MSEFLREYSERKKKIFLELIFTFCHIFMIYLKYTYYLIGGVMDIYYTKSFICNFYHHIRTQPDRLLASKDIFCRLIGLTLDDLNNPIL